MYYVDDSDQEQDPLDFMVSNRRDKSQSFLNERAVLPETINPEIIEGCAIISKKSLYSLFPTMCHKCDCLLKNSETVSLPNLPFTYLI